MGNGASSYVKSNVPTVHLLNNNSVVLNVRFDGFTANEPVEISGYVTQDSGAYSPFYCETKVPGDYGQTQEAEASQIQGTANVPVIIKQIDGLNPNNDLVVVAKVAKVWPTVLTSDQAKLAAAKLAATSPATTGPATTDPVTIIDPATIVKTWEALPPSNGASW